jgi:hypothetical protein
MKPIRIEEDRIVFAAVLVNGVPTVPTAMEEMAVKLAKRLGNNISSLVEGNRDEVWFYFDYAITEEEAATLAE